jgi:GxxExxY protein
MSERIEGEPDLAALNSITQTIIGSAFRVSNTLGPGFLEKVYENALAHELRKARLDVDQQFRTKVFYDNVEVGEYVTDLLVCRSVVVELKAIRALDDAHSAQCISFLAATRQPICLLLNFGVRVDIKRLVRPGLILPPIPPSVTSVPSVASYLDDLDL